MERPGGGPFLRDVCGVLMGRPKAPVVSPCRGVLSSSGAGPFPPCFWRASIICLCRSLTSRLRWSCSRMVGSCVWKPGERQAMPMSKRFALPWPEGRAVRAPEEWTMLWLERFSRCGRWRVVVVEDMSGEAGSFLTTILGAGPRDERGERLPSALNDAASLLEEVGEASWGSLEALELGVTAWGEEVEGAMAAYVLEEPTPSAVEGGAACWAGMPGLATAVVMIALRYAAQRVG
jgi:hypothetical protein